MKHPLGQSSQPNETNHMTQNSSIDPSLYEYMTPGCLNGSSAFITGGGSGIGLSIAHTLAALGANVGICGRRADKLKHAEDALSVYGGKIATFAVDIRDADAVCEALETCGRVNGPVNYLVCAAAGNFVASAESMSSNAFKTVVEIDLLGTFHAAKGAFEQLKATKGSALFISAGQAFAPYYGQSHVGAAKAGIEMLMQTLALEWGENSIGVNCIVPGPISNTRGMEVLSGGEAEDFWVSTVPMRRLGQASEIANLSAFLATPLADFITGTSIRVDGGQNLTGSSRFNEQVIQSLGLEE